MPFLKKDLSAEYLALSQNSQNSSLRTQNCKSKGFTLIELLVVIAIFGLTASLITASYLSFERNQRLKNAALMIKSDIRLIADKAFSGDKGVGTGVPQSCLNDASHILGGWYISFVKNNTNYSIAGDCLTGGGTKTEENYNSKLINLPKDVKICNIDYSTYTYRDKINVLFRPLSHDVYINDLTPPKFFDNSGNLNVTNYTGSDLIIELGLKCPATEGYQLIINSSGETREQKI